MSSSDRAGLGAPRLHEVADGVYAYVQPDGSWWVNNTGVLVGPHAVVSVDTCATEARTRAYLQAVAGLTRLPVRTLVNTHHHGDHTHGNSLLRGATIVAQEGTRTALLEAGLWRDPPFWTPFELGAVELEPPSLTYTDAVTIWVGDLRCEVRHVGGPAHTTNDSVVWIPDRGVLFSGDLLFAGGTPFVLMGSVLGSLRVLDEVVTPLGAGTIVPGHGEVCGPEVIEHVRGYLTFVRDLAERGRAAGLTPLALARETDLGPYADWHDRERIVGNLHRAYADLEAAEPTAADPTSAELGRPLDLAAALADMVTFNGGQPLTCLA